LLELSHSAVLVAVVGAVVAVVVLLWALSLIPTAYTALRRSVRNARITQRGEGWGGPKHRNQELIETPALSPVVDAITKLLPGGATPDGKQDEDAPHRAA
jgi:hypothetical protein